MTTTIKEDKTASFNVPVNCCGVVVNPGDIIFGNAEGVIVMKPEECEKLLEMGVRRLQKWKEDVRLLPDHQRRVKDRR